MASPARSRRPPGPTAFLFCAWLTVAAGCSDGSGPSSGDDSVSDLTSGSWELLSLRRGFDTITPVTGHQPVVTFGEEAAAGLEGFRRLTGNGGCNLMGGSYTVPDPGQLTVRELVSTERACLTDGVMGVEEAFFDALAAARRFEVRDGRLEIRFDGGSLTFRAAPPLEG